MNLPGFVWQAVISRQYEENNRILIAVFTTNLTVQPKGFSTLIDLIFSYWAFYFIPFAVLQKSLGSMYFLSETAKNEVIEKDLSIIPEGKFSESTPELFSQGLRLLANKNRRFKIALHRFAAAYKRTEPLDAVLDRCAWS